MNKLGRLHIPNATYQVQRVIRLLVLEKIFKGFLPYMGVAAILVMWPGPFEQTFVPAS